MKALFKKHRNIKAQSVRITDNSILNLEKTESQRKKTSGPTSMSCLSLHEAGQQAILSPREDYEGITVTQRSAPTHQCLNSWRSLHATKQSELLRPPQPQHRFGGGLPHSTYETNAINLRMYSFTTLKCDYLHHLFDVAGPEIDLPAPNPTRRSP